MTPIYLDNAATSKPWPQVIQVVADAMTSHFANPSSLYRPGLAAAREIANAAEAVVSFVGSGQWRVIFTSGGTESDVTAVMGAAPKGRRKGIITTTVEHAAVTDTCKLLAGKGADVTTVSAGPTGVIDPLKLSSHLNDNVALVSINHVANEMGTVQPVTKVAQLAKQLAPRCLVHVDAVQAAAQLPQLDYSSQVDMISISSHKIHGPKGVGALLLRNGVHLRPLLSGGDQQEGIRPGTQNVPGILGFAKACELMKQKSRDNYDQMRERTDKLIGTVISQNDGVRILGDPKSRAPGMAILAVEGVASQVLLHSLEMRGLLASSGSACHASRREPPIALQQAGLTQNEGALRLSLSIDTEQAQIDAAITIIKDAIDAVRLGRTG